MSFWRVVGVLAAAAAVVLLPALVAAMAIVLLPTVPMFDGPPSDDETREVRRTVESRVGHAQAGDSWSRPLIALDGDDVERLSAVDVPGVDCDGGSVDDLQAAVDRAASEEVALVIPRGARCRLDVTLEMPSGVHIEAGGAVVEGDPGAFRPRPDRESLVDVIDVSDVTVNGGVWRMAEDEGANVFEIRASSEVLLSGITATGAREDGFYIGRPYNEGVALDGVLAHDNGRSGISITTGREIDIVDSHAHDNGHVLDMRGLTIEPTSSGGPLTGIRIVNLETSGNARSGAAASLSDLGEDHEEVDIVFDGYRSFDEPVGLRVSKGMVGGSLRVIDAEFHRTGGAAFQLKDRWASAFNVEIVRPVIYHFGTNPSGRPRHDSAISVYTSDDDIDEPLGGVQIVEPTITAHPDAGSEAYYLFVGDNREEPAGVESTELVNPLRLRHGRGLSLEGDVHVGTHPSSEGLSSEELQED